MIQIHRLWLIKGVLQRTHDIHQHGPMAYYLQVQQVFSPIQGQTN